MRGDVKWCGRSTWLQVVRFGRSSSSWGLFVWCLCEAGAAPPWAPLGSLIQSSWISEAFFAPFQYQAAAVNDQNLLLELPENRKKTTEREKHHRGSTAGSMGLVPGSRIWACSAPPSAGCELTPQAVHPFSSPFRAQKPFWKAPTALSPPSWHVPRAPR